MVTRKSSGRYYRMNALPSFRLNHLLSEHHRIRLNKVPLALWNDYGGDNNRTITMMINDGDGDGDYDAPLSKAVLKVPRAANDVPVACLR